MIFRKMEVSDLDAARKLWAEAEGVELSKGDSVDELTNYLARCSGTSQVAELDGVVVGAVLAGHDGRRGFLYHLAVAPRASGKGVGRNLVRISLASLRQQGIPRVLILVSADNDGAFAFWRRCGWEDMSFARPMGIDI